MSIFLPLTGGRVAKTIYNYDFMAKFSVQTTSRARMPHSPSSLLAHDDDVVVSSSTERSVTITRFTCMNGATRATST